MTPRFFGGCCANLQTDFMSALDLLSSTLTRPVPLPTSVGVRGRSFFCMEVS